MEFCEGVTLDRWIADSSCRQAFVSDSGVEGALSLFSQVVAGLAELHGRGIVHRDVKPENIMVSWCGQVKIIDLDLARRAVIPVVREDSWPRRPPSEDCESLTEVGTPGYAPPEQCAIRAASNSPPASPQLASASPSPSFGMLRSRSPPRAEADIFSAGVVLVELLMAVVKDGPAWDTSMERACAVGALRAGQGELASLPPQIHNVLSDTGWLRQMIMRMLAWDARVRPSSEAVLRELHASLTSKDRRNPYVGAMRGPSPHLCAIMRKVAKPLVSAQNPYVGFFLDHGPRKCIAQAS